MRLVFALVCSCQPYGNSTKRAKVTSILSIASSAKTNAR